MSALSPVAFSADRPLAVDLFAGVGGLSLGLEMAGFFVLAHVEIEEVTGRYAAYNFPLAHHLTGKAGDIRDLRGSQLNDLAGGREIDLIAGGPPCQGFSRAGLRRQDDPLNDLVLEMARVVLEARPRAFLIENVPGIREGQYWQLEKALQELSSSYSISDPQLLRAEDYGVPQVRRRVFILGLRKDLASSPVLPAPTHSVNDNLFLDRTPNVADAIMDIPNCDDYEHLLDADSVEYRLAPHSDFARQMRSDQGLMSLRGYSVDWLQDLCTNVRRTKHGPELQSKLRELGQGAVEKSSRIPRLRLDGLGMTVRAGTTSERGSWSAPRACHPIHPRVLTTRENARLQTFPDWFRFHPVKWHGNRQVGNAVPPILAKAVGSALLAQLPPIETSAPRAPILVARNWDLIVDDIDAAGKAGYLTRRASHKVQNTNRASRQSVTVLSEKGDLGQIVLDTIDN